MATNFPGFIKLTLDTKPERKIIVNVANVISFRDIHCYNASTGENERTTKVALMGNASAIIVKETLPEIEVILDQTPKYFGR